MNETKALVMKCKEQCNKIIALVSVSFLVSMCITNLIFLPIVKASGTSNYIYIPDQYTSLQDAINNSSNGDIIQINSSINITNTIQINKSIILQGTYISQPNINGTGNNSINISISNVTIRNLTITNFSTAINIYNQSVSLQNISIYNVTFTNTSLYTININNSSNLSISNCTINNSSQYGVNLYNTTNSSFLFNTINNTQNAFNLNHHSNNNTLRNNTITNNNNGITIFYSSNNTVYYNIFIDNTYHAKDNATNNWDNGSYGNYWDNYSGTDENNDQIGDIVYTIPLGSGVDHYPLGYFVPIVNFTYSPLTPTTNTIIQFTDNSTDPNSANLNYSWVFNDGNTSYDQNPTHNYSDNGTYNVTLNITNTYGQSNQTFQIITVENVPPSISLLITPSVRIANETISFYAIAADNDGIIENWTWTFDDGTFSYTHNTTHTYSENGSYTVSLNATDDDGNYTNVSNSITITYRPVVNFSYSPTSPRTNQSVTFTDTSSDSDSSISSWSWNFGDGDTSSSQNPTHAYDTSGDFTITLNITDSHGATNQTTKSITISNTNPVANFSYSPLHPTDLQNITFSDNSTDSDGTIVNWTWSFGDGEHNYSQNATHKYDDNGTYTVTLNITDNDGSTNQTSSTITVLNVGPTADFTYEPTYPELGEKIWFNDTSTDPDGTIANWTWKLESDQSNYTQDCIYSFDTLKTKTITLTIKDNDGNTSTKSKQIIMKKTYTEELLKNIINSYDLVEECDIKINIKTTNDTNVSVCTYSETPSEINDVISSYKNLESYVNISLENESALEWIELTIYYLKSAISTKDINESSLKIFYWNETQNKWIVINSAVDTTNTGDYAGKVTINITHLTFFTLAGKENEEIEEITYTLPSIVSSLDNTTFHTTKPVFTVTYDAVAVIKSATVDGLSVDATTQDNKTFHLFLNHTISNGNYTLKITLKNGTATRTDSFTFALNITAKKSTQQPISIPVWVWYGIAIFTLLFLIIITNKKTQIINTLLTGILSLFSKKALATTDYSHKKSDYLDNTNYHKLLKLSKSLHLPSLDKNDPWSKTCAETQGLLHNIDLFVEKPDAYVAIQEKLMEEEEYCKDIFNIVHKKDLSANDIKNKTKIPDEELFKSISIMIKYGILEMKEDETFTISSIAKQIKNN